jgi:flagellar basal body-associated protein FliL
LSNVKIIVAILVVVVIGFVAAVILSTSGHKTETTKEQQPARTATKP